MRRARRLNSAALQLCSLGGQPEASLLHQRLFSHLRLPLSSPPSNAGREFNPMAAVDSDPAASSKAHSSGISSAVRSCAWWPAPRSRTTPPAGTNLQALGGPLADPLATPAEHPCQPEPPQTAPAPPAHIGGGAQTPHGVPGTAGGVSGMVRARGRLGAILGHSSRLAAGASEVQQPLSSGAPVNRLFSTSRVAPIPGSLYRGSSSSLLLGTSGPMPGGCAQHPRFSLRGCPAAWRGVSRRGFGPAGLGLRSMGSAPEKTVVAVGISGGVDSAVAALLLKQQGFQVVGMFMRNWDEGEETGNQNCSIEADLKDAKAVCSKLGIPLQEVNFVAEYWNQVFEDFVGQYARGLTPNPDLACNRQIKFGALLSQARQLGADFLATGHYARLIPTSEGVQLHRGADLDKDQSYFLASVGKEAFEQAMFPVGHLTKAAVRDIAQTEGLTVASKKSSTGICFIGKRKFGDFIGEYVDPMPARFVDVDTGRDLGHCQSLSAVTFGQRAGIGGLPDRMYVAGKDIVRRVVYVAQGHDNPALFCSHAVLHSPNWIAGVPPQPIAEGRPWTCSYQSRYRETPGHANVLAAAAASIEARTMQMGRFRGDYLAPSSFYQLLPDDARSDDATDLHVRFSGKLGGRAITPQQAFVMYDTDRCLGSALVRHPGLSLKEQLAGEMPETESLIGESR